MPDNLFAQALYDAVRNICDDEMKSFKVELHAIVADCKQQSEECSRRARGQVSEMDASLKTELAAMHSMLDSRASVQQLDAVSTGLSERLISLQGELHSFVPQQQLDATILRIRQQIENVDNSAERKLLQLESSSIGLRESLSSVQSGLLQAREERDRIREHVLSVQSLAETGDAELRRELSSSREQIRGLHDLAERWAQIDGHISAINNTIDARVSSCEQRVTGNFDAALAHVRNGLEQTVATVRQGWDSQLHDKCKQHDVARDSLSVRLQAAIDASIAHADEQVRASEQRWRDDVSRLEISIGGLHAVIGDKASERELNSAVARVEAHVTELHAEQLKSAVAHIEERASAVLSLVGGGTVTEAQLEGCVQRMQEQIVAVQSVLTQSLSQMVSEEHLKVSIARLEEHVSGLQAVVGEAVSEHQLEVALSRIHQQVSVLKFDVMTAAALERSS